MSESSVTLHKKHVSVPFASVLAVVASAFGAGGTWAVMRGDIVAGHAYTLRVELESKERDAKAERRLEKLEDVNTRVLDFMARIDERTAQTQRDVAELKQRHP